MWWLFYPYANRYIPITAVSPIPYSVGVPRRIDPLEACQVMRAAGLEPLDPFPGAHGKWRCICANCGEEVFPAYSSVKSGQGGCKPCGLRASAASRKMSHDEASHVMRENGFEPLEPYPGSQKPWRCQCLSCGNEVLVRRNTVATSGTGCKYCWSERRGKSRLLSEDAAVAVMRAAGLEPLDPYVRSGDPWRCLHLECGREVFPSYNSIQQGSGGCQVCGYLKTATAIRHDEEYAFDIMRAAGFEPLESYPGSKSHWRCIHLECEKEVTPTFHDVSRGDGGCFTCGARKRGQASRLDPEEARKFMLENGLDPQEPYELSNKPWACIHLECGSLVHPTYSSIKNGQRGCRNCADRLTGLRTSYSPEFAIEQATSRGYLPLEDYPGAMNPWRCTHAPCGQTVTATLNTLMSGKGCCKPCGIASRAEKNRYTPEEAVATMTQFGLVPLEDYPGYFEKWRCRHTTCGREVNPTFWYVKFRESGCKFCANKGLDYTGEGIVYLLKRTDYFSAKIGISTPNSKTDRIAAHVKEGWQLVHSWRTATAIRAEEIEGKILRWWRFELEAPISMRREDMKSGWTETASLLYVDIEETCKRIDILLSDEISSQTVTETTSG